MPDKEITWCFNSFVDVCHAGSCVDKARRWDQRNNDGLHYFCHNCKLNFKIHCSCLANELASDCGSGKGGLWLNHFIAKGNKNYNDMDGKVFKVFRLDENGEEKEFTQTSNCYELWID